MRTERDIRNQMAYAHDKGLEEGIESERLRIKENLRKKGFSEEEIAKIMEY
jgi:SOS response regulatory protein OraA/RecX